MKRRNFLLLMASLAGVPFLPKDRTETHLLALNELPSHSHIPVGTIQPFAGANLPGGWLPCDGRMISPNHYPKLFEVLHDKYGSKLPDLTPRWAMHGDDFVPMQHIIKAS